jgi:hypothetical protein
MHVAEKTAIQIGELSRRAACNTETIRYYERLRLLPARLAMGSMIAER